jgi:hypothetical protein
VIEGTVYDGIFRIRPREDLGNGFERGRKYGPGPIHVDHKIGNAHIVLCIEQVYGVRNIVSVNLIYLLNFVCDFKGLGRGSDNTDRHL